jgi:hypothetical protein
VRSAIDGVLERHDAPPTRQEMVLAAVRSMAKAGNLPVSAELAQTISDASHAQELYAILDASIRDFPVAASLTGEGWTALEQGWAPVVPGGIRLIPQKAKAVEEQLAANRYVGIGVSISIDGEKQRPRFFSVFEGGPAELSGIRKGDLLDQVDGMRIQGRPINEIVDLLRGPEGSIVTLSVQSGDQEPVERTVRRSVVPIKTIKPIPQGASDRVALLAIETVRGSTVHEIRTAVARLPESTDTVILDLRNTHADSLRFVHLLADELLNEADIGEIRSRTGKRRLRTEEGTGFANRNVALVIRGLGNRWPATNTVGQFNITLIDWLAQAAQSQKILVLDESQVLKYEPVPGLHKEPPSTIKMAPLGIHDSFAIPATDRLLEIRTGQLMPSQTTYSLPPPAAARPVAAMAVAQHHWENTFGKQSTPLADQIVKAVLVQIYQRKPDGR